MGAATSFSGVSDMGLLAAAPFSAVVFFAIVVLLLDFLLPPGRKWVLPLVSLVGLLASSVLVTFLWGREVVGFSGAISLDRFSSFFDLLLLLGTALVVLSSFFYARREGIERGEYYSLLLFATSGAMLMASAVDMVVFFLGLEILSVSLYVLSGFFRDRTVSVEAAVKYFVLGAFASGFLLYGIALFYGAAGSTQYGAMQAMLSSGGDAPTLLVYAACALLMVGLCFKLGSVPFHMWVPDVYQGAPTSVTGYMSVVSKAAVFAAFVRIFGTGLAPVQIELSKVLWVLAVATMTLGNLAAISQTNIKRMLAYSSIAHAGYLLVALTAAGRAGYSSVLFYALAYAFMTLGAFGVIALLRREEQEALDLTSYSGLSTRHPLLSGAMALFMISLAGIPPTGGFFAKFYVFSAAVGAGYVDLAVIGVLNSLVSVYFYMRIVYLMYMKEETVGIEAPPSLAARAALLICVLGTLAMGVFPSGFARLVASSVSAIF
ncbi:MAG: NADH-quinone oxidoreductase subunit N [Candidatus Eiseniibacteriota bacterium]|nr:MAG: NADH-quinone oxidoreductase subunit N [Candidatus Eisenbacteria bacterium]